MDGSTVRHPAHHSGSTSVLHTAAAEPVVVGLVLCLLVGAITLIRWRDDRYRRWAIALMVVAAIELIIALWVPRDWYLFLALPLGAVVLFIYAVWLRRSGGLADDPVEGSDHPAFETLYGGETIVEGGEIRGYKRVSRVVSAVARFVDVNLRRH